MLFYRATKSTLTYLILPGLLFAAVSCSNAGPSPSPSPTPVSATSPTPVPAGSPAPATSPSPPATTPVASPVEIKISGFAFSPAEVTVKVGTKVTWINQDTTPHTITGDGNLFDSGRMAKDDTYSYTFTAKGIYSYACDYHRSMRGKVNVVE